MGIGDHARVTGSALKNWLVGQIQDSIIVGLIWLVGLLLIKVPLAPFWALLAAVLQFIPQVGAALGMVGPVIAAWLRVAGLGTPAVRVDLVRRDRHR